ncbi:MAG: PepSY domain-containing protein [Chloroflexi bacterium]|nr:PepSY domain-containing protein [Chloroflexota bacterium]
MRTNQKSLLSIFLISLLLVIVGGAVLVAAQDTAPSAEASGIQNGDDNGEAETPASASDAVLTEAEAVAIAEAERGSTATYVELERERGVTLYSIELTDNSEVEINANTGEVIEIELPGTDND